MRGIWRWLAAVGATAVLAAALVLVLGDDDGDEEALVEVFRQPVADVGPDPFTDPVAEEPSANIATYATAPPPPADGVAEVGSVDGGEPGLYGGTLEEASCDADQLVAFLESDPQKAAAWAGVIGIQPDEVGAYVDGLTPLLLPADTRVTNHGFADGEAYPLQSVLQAGTAVLVDSRGVPRVRCYCGNPLLPPEAADEGVDYTGDGWSTFDVATLRVVAPAPEPLEAFVVTDVDSGATFRRPVGSDGSMDEPVDGPPDDAGGDAGGGDEGLTGPLVATGGFEPIAVAGASYTTNRITLRFDSEGGEVVGDAQIAITIGGATPTGTADFTGTFDPAAGSMSGNFSSVGSFGGFTAGGGGTWSATVDLAAGTVTGSISAVDGSPAPFNLTIAAA